MTLQEAAARGVSRVHKDEWAKGYLRIGIYAGKLAPWAYLFDRPAQEVEGAEIPQAVLAIGDNADDWEAYAGPLDEKDKQP